MFHKMKSIRSENHKIYSVEINKKSLSCFDDKRYILSNGIDSFAYGHYYLKKIYTIIKKRWMKIVVKILT